MNNICKAALMVLAMTGLSSCLGKVQYYEHEPTHIYRGTANKMKSSSFKKLLDFTDNGIVFVPEFAEMGPSRHPRSFLIFYSRSMVSIYIDKAILHSGSKMYKKELTVNKVIETNKRFKSFFKGSVFLFGDDVNGLDKIWNEDFAILEVYYRIPEDGKEGQLKKMTFKLELKTTTEIAWST